MCYTVDMAVQDPWADTELWTKVGQKQSKVAMSKQLGARVGKKEDIWSLWILLKSALVAAFQ